MKNISRIFFAIVILTWAVGNAFAGGEENIVVGDSATEWQQLQVLEDKIWEDKDENSAPDLVFLDVEMPNGNGFTLLSSFDQVNFEEHFSQLTFFRAHDSFMVNLNHVVSYIRGRGAQVVLSEGSTVDVSREKKSGFLEKFSKWEI